MTKCHYCNKWGIHPEDGVLMCSDHFSKFHVGKYWDKETGKWVKDRRKPDPDLTILQNLRKALKDLQG